jgi:rare lipoprotein A
MDRTFIAKTPRLAVILVAGASLVACATMTPKYAAHPSTARQAQAAPGYKTGQPYQVGGIWYVPHDQPNYDERGIASWYGDAFNMKATADGEVFDMNAFSAAHTTLPLPSMVEVTNLDNGRKLTVRVNDRGPFVGARIIDLSHAAAQELGYDRQGLAHVRVRYLGPAPLAGPEAGVRYAQARPAAPAPAPIAAPLAVANAVPPPAPSVQYLEPSDIPVADLPPAPAAVSVAELAPPAAPPASAANAQIFRIQAGAFSDEANARRAQAQLAQAGPSLIEPLQRDGTTLYRVILTGPSDEAQAFALRDRVAGIGFADARVVRPNSAF